MPHLSLEYSANARPQCELPDLFSRLHQILADAGGIRIGNCKSRARVCEPYLVAKGDRSGAFVHLGVQFLEGRTRSVKRAIGDEMLAALRGCFPPSTPDQDLQITVELRDLARDDYFKYPEGTFDRVGSR